MRSSHAYEFPSAGASAPAGLLHPREARRRHAPAETAYAQVVKPALDRMVALVLLVLLLPVIAGVAVAVWAQLGGPILLRQQRVARGGATFSMYKFRTMLPSRRSTDMGFDGPDRRQTHKHPDDPRHTRLGRFLRAYSLDELPQLFNVVKGDMSLVGPRPELVEVVKRHYQPWQHIRHAVKPGLTGLWQITHRGTLMYEHTDVDIEYIARVSLRTDLGILVRTVPALMGLKGF